MAPVRVSVPAPVLAMLAPVPLILARKLTADPFATSIVCGPLESATARGLTALPNTTGYGLLVVIFPVIVSVPVPVNEYGAYMLQNVRLRSDISADPNNTDVCICVLNVASSVPEKVGTPGYQLAPFAISPSTLPTQEKDACADPKVAPNASKTSPLIMILSFMARGGYGGNGAPTK